MTRPSDHFADFAPERVRTAFRSAEDLDDQIRRIADAIGISTRDAAREYAKALRTAVRDFTRISENMTGAVNTPTAVAGTEGRYWVRAALDPAYTSPEARDGLLRAVLTRSTGDDRVDRLTTANAALVAAAVLQGWVTSRLDRECACTLGAYSSRCPVDRHRRYAHALGRVA